jgi:hypothetical protein
LNIAVYLRTAAMTKHSIGSCFRVESYHPVRKIDTAGSTAGSARAKTTVATPLWPKTTKSGAIRPSVPLPERLLSIA